MATIMCIICCSSVLFYLNHKVWWYVKIIGRMWKYDTLLINTCCVYWDWNLQGGNSQNLKEGDLIFTFGNTYSLGMLQLHICDLVCPESDKNSKSTYCYTTRRVTTSKQRFSFYSVREKRNAVALNVNNLRWYLFFSALVTLKCRL